MSDKKNIETNLLIQDNIGRVPLMWREPQKPVCA